MLLRRYHEVKETKEIELKPIIKPLENEANFNELTVKELNRIALEKGIDIPKRIKKDELIRLIREG